MDKCEEMVSDTDTAQLLWQLFLSCFCQVVFTSCLQELITLQQTATQLRTGNKGNCEAYLWVDIANKRTV